MNLWKLQACHKAETVVRASKEPSALAYGPEDVTDHQWGWKQVMETACEEGRSQDEWNP